MLDPKHQALSPGSISPKQELGKSRRQGSPALFDSNDVDSLNGMDKANSNETTPRAKKIELANRDKRSSLFDISLNPSSKASSSTADPSQGRTKSGAPNKIMTPAQFEQYRQEQERTRRTTMGPRSDDSDDESDHYEDDDEAERNKLLAKQRRKQEAHLAVYRQQMMKMTGEQPSDLPDIGIRPGLERTSMSAPNVGLRGPTPTFSIDKASASGKASDEEDEDVPLGVLAAHGFPNKNRPPAVLSSNGIRYSSESYPAPPKSTSGASAAGGSRNLPPFAKNLPSDPYYGAGLVNPSNRETPSFSNHGGSTYGGSSSNLPPGGLVGVIAGEERARAMRRGSPNAQGNYSSPLPQGMQQMLPAMPPMMSSGDEAQIQMSHQMTQMMQMQMRWMQQMQQMMVGGMQGQQQPPGMPPLPPPHQPQPMNGSFLSPQGQIPRPMSHSAPSSPALAQQQQRAMSMMSPVMNSPWPPRGHGPSAASSTMNGVLGPTNGYAPSIAPSERSNVGMPSRYRPVSIAPADEQQPRPGSRASPQLLHVGGDRRNIISSSLAGKESPSPRKVPSDEDNDDEGWEEMKKKREQKASTWRLRKSHGNDFKDLYYPGT